MLRRLLVPTAETEECRQVGQPVLKEGLLGVVADPADVPPRYRVHWVEDAVERLANVLDDLLQGLRVGVGAVGLVDAVKEFSVDVWKGVARKAGVDFPEVEQRVEEEEGHRRQVVVDDLVFEHDLVASKAVVADKADPLLFSFQQEAVDEGHELVVGGREGQRLHLLKLLLAWHVVLWVHRRLDNLFRCVGVDAAEEPVVLALGSNLMNRTLLSKVQAYITGEFKVVVDDQGGLPQFALVGKIH